MAIDLTISLTDAQQAKLESIADQVAPGMSPAERKAWAEKKAKEGLRQAVLHIWMQHVNQTDAWQPEP